jgi:putative phosphoesterase
MTIVREDAARIIGIISDTHGVIRSEAIAALQGSNLIIHAGDIGSRHVLEALRAIAPVVAVRGNNDTEPWAEAIPTTRVIKIAGVQIYLLHDVHDLSLDPAAKCFHAVVSGHSHRPSIAKRNEVLFINPGSAGPRRFNLPVSVARLHVHNQALQARLIELTVLKQNEHRSTAPSIGARVS